jgi:hypothetical protein
MIDNQQLRFQVMQLVHTIESPQEKFSFLQGVQQFCEELKHNVAERANFQYAEIISDAS